MRDAPPATLTSIIGGFMKRYILTGIVVVLGMSLFIVPHGSSAQTAPAWPTFHANNQRTGLTTIAGPTANTVGNQWQLPAAVESSPAVDASGTAYVGCDDGKVYALSPLNSSTWKWAFATRGPVLSSPTLSADGKTLFVGSDDGNVYGVDTATGHQVWTASAGSAVRNSPVLSYDGKVVYALNANGDIYTLNVADGTQAHPPVNGGAPAAGNLALDAGGQTLFVANGSAYAYGFSVYGDKIGQVAATYYLDTGATSTPVIDGNGYLYVATQRGNLEVFQPGSNTPRTFTIGPYIPAYSTPSIGAGLVVFGASNGNLYALSQSSLQPSWSVHTGGAINSSAAISQNGMVYVGSEDGILYAFATTDGHVVWRLDTGAPVESSPAIAADGSLWVGSKSGVVYRVGQQILTPTPTTSITPTVTFTPAPTRTLAPTSVPPTATATRTPSPTATSVPEMAQFTLKAVRVQASAKPNWSTKARSLGTVRAGKNFTIGVYVDVTRLPNDGKLSFAWVIKLSGKTAGHHGKHLNLSAGRVGRHWSHWEHALSRSGTYVVVGSAELDGVKKTKTLTLRVTD